MEFKENHGIMHNAERRRIMGEELLRQKPVIQVQKLRKEYIMGEERVVALKNINLSINRGEICCIFGTSGSGKSTLLNQLAGL